MTKKSPNYESYINVMVLNLGEKSKDVFWHCRLYSLPSSSTTLQLVATNKMVTEITNAARPYLKVQELKNYLIDCFVML